MKAIKPYLISITAFLAIDALWLGLMTPRVYSPALGPIISDQPRLLPALVFYVFFAAVLVKLIVKPAMKLKQSTATVARSAGLFGAAGYGTYELTNYATIASWPLHIVIIDIIWGASLSAIVAVIVLKIIRRP